jgi:2-oxoglutarate-dependent dioxygenase
MDSLARLRASFARDGFVALGRVLDDATLHELRESIERRCRTRDGAPLPDVRDLSSFLDGPGPSAVWQRVNIHAVEPSAARLARRPDVLDAVEAVLGPDLRLLRDQCFYKPPRCGGEVFLHQDNRYWHLDPPAAVTVFFALDDCTVDTGCVHFIAGSHRWGRVSHRRAAGGRSVLLEAEVDKALGVPLELTAGHASMHHCETLHWSPPNTSARPRRAHTIQYVRAGVAARGEPLTGLPVVRSAGGEAGA